MKLVYAAVSWCSFLTAQMDSRVAEIEAARQEKSQQLEADENSKLERTLLYIKDNKILERLSAGIFGFRLKLGGLVSGGGFAVGPEYIRHDLARGKVLLRGAAQASIKRYQKFDFEFGVPKFARRKLFLDLYAVHRNYPGINYYGPGPDSEKTARSNFRLEDTDLDATFGVKPWRHLSIGTSGGYLLVNTGPGGDSRFISSDRAFTPAQTPGIDRQANFRRLGALVQYDYRDNPGGPSSGGNYFVEFHDYSDRSLGVHDFRRLDVELQQYIPYFNKRRVFALRGKSVLTWVDSGQRVPFYLQPVLGGSDDLRGYRPFRFYDDNLMVLNAEHRWEVFSGLDMALFADAGKVFHRHAQWNFKDLESSVGFGLRFNARDNVFLRIDVGFSHEGFQVWFKFNSIFDQGPMRATSGPRIF